MTWCWYALPFVFLTFLFSSKVTLFGAFDQSTVFSLDLMKSGPLSLPLVFCVDKISTLFILMTLFVSSVVFLYALEYMVSDSRKVGFMVILLLFSLSMMFLSLSGNLFTVMLGWDGLGLTSFCLILFYQNWSSFNSAMITFMTNRLGDVCMVTSILLSLWSGGIFWNTGFPLLETSLTIVGGMTKSAQVPFSAWLPRAMAAPTPVSALVHSSTLVTAGVFVLARFYTVFSHEFCLFVQLISVVTILFASVNSFAEYDLKKIIALSTLSHIGLMFFSISSGFLDLGLLHMVMHSVFKSTLFMVAGWLIHKSGGEQDIRRLSVGDHSPGVSICLLVCLLSMMGFPFMSGFFSKEKIFLSLESSGEVFHLGSFFLSSFLTCSYSSRLLLFLVKGSPSLMTMNSGSGVGGVDSLLTFGTLSSSIFAGSVVSILMSDSAPFPSPSSTWGSKILFILMLTGILLSVVPAYLVGKGFTLMKILGYSWMSGSMSDALTLSVRRVSLSYLWKVDIKGHLDFPFLVSPLQWGKGMIVGWFYPLTLSLLGICVFFVLVIGISW